MGQGTVCSKTATMVICAPRAQTLDRHHDSDLSLLLLVQFFETQF